MSTNWNCYGCRMTNKFNRKECQACFRPCPKVRKSLSYEKQHQSTLINGFIKTYCEDREKDGHLLYKDILSIVLLFYNDITEWVISHTDLEELKKNIENNANNHDSYNTILYGPTIIINNLEFEEQLSFRNDRSDGIEQVLFSINLKPSNFVKSVQLTIYLGCDKTQTVYKRYSTDVNNYNNYRYNNEFECEENEEIEELNGCCFSLNDFDKDIKLIKLLSHIDILSLNNHIYRNILMDQINKNIKFVWYIPEFLLKQFLYCKNAESFWCDDSFGIDNNFCVWCAPNGMKPKDEGKFLIYLGLLALPYNINKLFVNYTFEIKSEQNTIDNNGINTFEYYCKYSSNGYLGSTNPYLTWNTNPISLKSLENLQSLTLIITLSIIEKH